MVNQDKPLDIVSQVATRANILLAKEYAKGGDRKVHFVDMLLTWAVLTAYLDWMKEQAK